MTCWCGLESPQECKEFFDGTLVKEFSDIHFVSVHRLTVDTYSLQHPEQYMVSVKSFAAHLTGMCCAMEYGNDSELLRTLQQWLNGKAQLQKPDLIRNVGNLKITHIVKAKDGKDHAMLVQEWARDVWDAYGVYHPLVREWVEKAKRDYKPR
jgi:hypothetical protein